MKPGSGSGAWQWQQGGSSQLGKARGWQTPSTGIGTWQVSFQSWGEHQRDYAVQPNSSTGRNDELNKGQNVLCSARHLKIPLCPRYNRKWAQCGGKELFQRFLWFLLEGWPREWTWVSNRHSLFGTYWGNNGEQVSPEMQVLSSRSKQFKSLCILIWPFFIQPFKWHFLHCEHPVLFPAISCELPAFTISCQAPEQWCGRWKAVAWEMVLLLPPN